MIPDLKKIATCFLFKSLLPAILVLLTSGMEL